MSTEECSSNESGWTTYIASSPDKEDDPTQDEDDECGSSMDEGVNQQESEDDAENMDTDDSMASDASSGPSDRKRLSNTRKKNERKLYGGEKCHKKEDRKKSGEKIKVEEEKSETKGNSGEISDKKL
ncbi:protein SOB FIVE-LIKE 4-like [Primulina huaijiensis]|uniref:protein SOB FIVE-LIKE 4-like n=1 Tax=Primulina huaijiensis TaxID=1492673 RepID=UPI003CC7116F